MSTTLSRKRVVVCRDVDLLSLVLEASNATVRAPPSSSKAPIALAPPMWSGVITKQAIADAVINNYAD